MADTQIHPFGDEAAPAAYELPAAAEVRLKGAFARFDGSAAAGSFRPLLRIVSDADTVALETEADVTVAAGGSADASWFPHVAAPAGGGIDFDQPNTDPLGAGGALRIDTGFIVFGQNIPADWQIDAIDLVLTTTGAAGIDLEVGGGTMQLNSFEVAGSGGVFITSGERSNTMVSGDTALQIRSGGVYQLSATLPVADPGVSGQLWNDLGTLKVSP